MQGTPVEDRIGYRLKEAQHALRTAMDRALGERGLTTPQYAVLSALDEEPGLSNADLARRAFVTPQTMNSIVVLLEHTGLVERRPHAVHGRVLSTALTPAGSELVHSCDEVVWRIEERMLAPLSDAERVQLAVLLRTCATALRNNTRPRRSQDGR
jgi:DNA-binding MarR family transcriptional regulator